MVLQQNQIIVVKVMTSPVKEMGPSSGSFIVVYTVTFLTEVSIFFTLLVFWVDDEENYPYDYQKLFHRRDEVERISRSRP